MSSEFRKTEDAAAVTDQLSDTEVEDDAFTTEQEEAMQQAGAKQEVTVDPPSSRTRARNTKKAASKKVAFAGSSGYSSNDSPALTKEFKDEQRLKRNLAKAKRQEEAGKTGDEWKIDPSDPSLRVGTEEWRMSKDKAGIAAYNSSRKNTMRLPGHGGINEIVNDPSSLVPSNGVVTIRAFEYHQLAVLLEVSTGDIWHFDLRHWHECLSSIFIMRLLMLSFLMQSMKEGQEGGTKLLDAVSKLAEQVPSESRQEMENLLVAARSQHNAAQNTLAHRNDVVAELCDIVNRLAVIWETTKQDLDGAKADMAKQEKAVASLRKKLLADIGQVRESVKRKASVTATADIEEMRDFRASFDRMVEDNSKMQQAAAAELQEVAKVVRTNREAHDLLASVVDDKLDAGIEADRHKRATDQRRRDLSNQARARIAEQARTVQEGPAGLPAQAVGGQQEQAEVRTPAEVPAPAPLPRLPVSFGPAPQPNITVGQQGVPVIRAQLVNNGAIPRRPPQQPQQRQQRAEVQQQMEPAVAEPAWLSNPNALQYRAEQIRAGVAPTVYNFVLPGRGRISNQEYAQLNQRQRDKVRTVKWTSRMNNPEEGSAANKGRFGCYKCQGDVSTVVSHVLCLHLLYIAASQVDVPAHHLQVLRGEGAHDGLVLPQLEGEVRHEER